MRLPFAASVVLLLASGVQAADPAATASAPFTLTPGRITQLKATTVIYQSLHIRVSDAEAERKATEDLLRKLAAAKVRVTGGPIFIFLRLPTGPDAESDLDIAIPVPDNTPAPDGCQSRTLEAVPSVMAIYQGPTASLGQAASRLFQQLHTLQQVPTGEMRTRSLYYEDAASSNNIVLLEIPTATP